MSVPLGNEDKEHRGKERLLFLISQIQNNLCVLLQKVSDSPKAVLGEPLCSCSNFPYHHTHHIYYDFPFTHVSPSQENIGRADTMPVLHVALPTMLRNARHLGNGGYGWKDEWLSVWMIRWLDG